MERITIKIVKKELIVTKNYILSLLHACNNNSNCKERIIINIKTCILVMTPNSKELSKIKLILCLSNTHKFRLFSGQRNIT